MNIVMDGSILDWNRIRHLVGARLINAKGKKEYLADKPHRTFIDMELVYVLCLDSPETPISTLTINWELCREWNVSEEDLYRESRRNLPLIRQACAYRMDDLLMELLFPQGPDADNLLKGQEALVEPPALFVITNEEREYGAVAAFYDGVLDHFLSRMGYDSAYLIPSSVHEMLVLPWDGIALEELLEMVRDVNDHTLGEGDRLSYSVYYYNRITRTLSRCDGDENGHQELFGLSCYY